MGTSHNTIDPNTLARLVEVGAAHDKWFRAQGVAFDSGLAAFHQRNPRCTT